MTAENQNETNQQHIEDAIIIEQQSYATKGEARVAVIKKDFHALFEGSDMKKHLAGLKQKYSKLKVSGVEDVETYEQIKKAISVVRPLRTGLEKKSKELKEYAQSYIKEVNSQEKFIQEEIAKIEDPLWAEREKYEGMVKAEQERIEKEAQERYESRMNELKLNGLKFDGEMYSIRDISIDAMFLKGIDDEKYNSLLGKVKGANELNIQEEKARQEAEEARKKDEEEARKKLEEAQREAERIKAELKAQQDELDRKMKEFEDKKRQAEEEERKEKARKEAEEARIKKEKEETEAKRIAQEKLDTENKIISNKSVYFNGLLNYDFNSQTWKKEVGKTSFVVKREDVLSPEFNPQEFAQTVKTAIEEEEKTQEAQRQSMLDDSAKLKEYISKILEIEIPQFNNLEIKNKVVGVLSLIQKMND